MYPKITNFIAIIIVAVKVTMLVNINFRAGVI